jgi:hypothetical protein
LIVNDEYISKSFIVNDSDGKLITRNELHNFFLEEIIKNTNTDSINVLNLEIDILNKKKINFTDNQIKEIYPNTLLKIINHLEIQFYNYLSKVIVDEISLYSWSCGNTGSLLFDEFTEL